MNRIDRIFEEIDTDTQLYRAVISGGQEFNNFEGDKAGLKRWLDNITPDDSLTITVTRMSDDSVVYRGTARNLANDFDVHDFN